MRELAKKLLEARKNKSIIQDEVIGKTFHLEIVNKILSIDVEKKTVDFVMSTSSIDRHGDIVDQDSMILDYIIQNPNFSLFHRTDSFPIGRWIKIGFENDPDNIGQKRLVGTAEFRTEFADAERAFIHVQKGDMSAVSIGFIPHRVEYDEAKDAFVLYDCEILECSLVGVGSNRQALAKTVEDDRTKLIEARDALDSKIKKGDNNKVIQILKAREALNQVIRRLK